MLPIAEPSPKTPTSLFLRILAVVLAATVLSAAPIGRAQAASVLSQVKRVYVEPLGHGSLGNEFRDRVVTRLRKDGALEVVPTGGQADAILSGMAEIWVTGYVSSSPRSPSQDRRPIYSGYLSARVTRKNGTVLWSYLVTPRKFAWGGIVKDLADNLVAKLMEARADTRELGATTPAHDAVARALHGAGATFPAPLYQKWFQSFEQQNSNTHISYDMVGSGGGIQLLAAGKVDFAASDMPLSDERMSQLGAKFRQYATVLGAVVPIYNLEGVTRPLNFTPEVLAEIYLGKIRRWNDPQIKAVNRHVSLPDREIVVIHRSDGSGTTFVWTDYLSKVSPEWKQDVGSESAVKWPIGLGAEHNEGVAQMVRQMPDSIGYVEMVFALQHQLSFGSVRNAHGEFVRADLSSVTAAAASASEGMTSDFRVSITNASGEGAYPIASFTWLLLLEQGLEPGHEQALTDLLQWILTSGQKECSELGYAPLPRDLANQELRALHGEK